MLERVMRRERAEAARPAPAIGRDLRDEHRTRVLARTHAMPRNPDKVQVDPAGKDGPTLEQYMRHQFERVDVSRQGHSELGAGSMAFIVRDGSTVQRLQRRGHIRYRQYWAALTYQSLHHRSRLSPRVVASYGQGRGGGDAGAWLIAPAQKIVEHRQSLKAARDAMGSQLVVTCVEAVVIYDATLTAVGIRLGNRGGSARRKGSEVVTAGLDALVRHFGLMDVRED